MTHQAPGKAHREGMTLAQLFKMFPNDSAAERWFANRRWPDGVHCPHCGSTNVQGGAKHKTMPYRCREKACAKRFSVRTGTPMEASNLGYQVWAIATYQITTSLKGVSSMKLHRDLGITQRSAWFLLHRLREAWKEDDTLFSGPVEADEIHIGGLEKNKHAKKRQRMGRGSTGKTIVAGALDRPSNHVVAKVVPDHLRVTLGGFVAAHVAPEAIVYTDESSSYSGLPHHESVVHSRGEYVNGDCHTNSIESFWAMLKRAHKGTFRKLSPKHMQRYVTEFAGRHNQRDADIIDQMAGLVRGMEGRRLRYTDLVAG